LKYTTFDDKQSVDVLTINIFRTFSHYNICYTKSFYRQNFTFLSHFKYDETHYEKLNHRDTGYALKEYIIKCPDCHQENAMKIKFADLTGTVCKNCLIINVTEIIEQRIKYFISEQYLNLECNIN